MSVVTYTANDRAALIAGHVAGELYSFEIAFMRFEKSYNSPKKQHTSIGGVVETVLARTDELIAVEIGPYDSDDIPQIEEFIKSVSSGESFQLDVHGTVAVASLPISAKLNDNKNTPTRHGPRTYSLSFNVLANASGYSVGGVAPLPPVEEVETPFFGGWFSGNAGCTTGGVKPTWSSGGLFVREVNATGMSVFISQFKASDGGSNITLWEIAPGFSLPGSPSTIALNSATSELAGDSGGIAVGDYPVAFTMTNADGLTSDVSPVFIIRFFNSEVTPVNITGISAVAGSNVVDVILQEACYTSAGSAASYEADGFFTVNSIPRNHNYLSGGGTTIIKHTLDGSALADDDVVQYVHTAGNLQSTANDSQVPSSTNNYVVASIAPPTEGSSWSTTRNFNSGSIGQLTTGSDGFDRAVIKSFYANDQKHLGTNVCQCNLEVNERFWGGIIDFPSVVGNGGVIYLEFYNKIPDYFDFDIGNGSMKYIIFSERDSSGSPAGRLHLQPRSGSGNRNFRWIKEGGGFSYQNYPTSGDTHPLKRNVWQKHNVEIGVGHVARDIGGNAYVKHWIDDVLIEDNGANKTIVSSTGTLYEFKFLDFYNDLQSSATPQCAPYARRMWIDDITLSAD